MTIRDVAARCHPKPPFADVQEIVDDVLMLLHRYANWPITSLTRSEFNQWQESLFDFDNEIKLNPGLLTQAQVRWTPFVGRAASHF